MNNAFGLSGITRIVNAQSRSISAENVYGAKGRGGMAEVSDVPQPEVAKIGQKWDGPNKCARDLGRTWKVRPCITLRGGSVSTLMDVDGPGAIQHIWITRGSQALPRSRLAHLLGRRERAQRGVPGR